MQEADFVVDGTEPVAVETPIETPVEPEATGEIVN